jgi:hypothetical protein
MCRTMRDRYIWQPDEPFEYNLAVQKIPPFVDKLHALHDRTGYLAGQATWYDDWTESPGGIMLADNVKPHEREDALRTDFLPIARYVAHDHDSLPGLRHEYLQAFVVLNAIDSDRQIWANEHGQPYALSDLLPADIGSLMFRGWLDSSRSHIGAVRMLESRSVSHQPAA